MVKKISSSQLRNKLRQIQSKQRQAVNKYNQEVRNYNSNLKSAVNKYNQAVRTHNANVQRNRNVIKREIRKLESNSKTTTTYQRRYYDSSISLNNSYNRVAITSDNLKELSPQQNHIYDLIEQENANNLSTYNAILNDEISDNVEVGSNDDTLAKKLNTISIDLHDRWKGAVFSLSPKNPDATRHFCTSAREIFTKIIETKAPDEEVFKFDNNCKTTDKGNPTRREKIRYLISSKKLIKDVIDFVEDDIENVLELFHVLSEGTHGEAKNYSNEKLILVKKRVEDGLAFLCDIAI
jgi:hypothetical protein